MLPVTEKTKGRQRDEYCRVRWVFKLCGTGRQCGPEDKQRQGPAGGGGGIHGRPEAEGHCEVLMIKWRSRTELHNSVKAKAVSNLKWTAGLTWGLPVGGHIGRRQFKVTLWKSTTKELQNRKHENPDQASHSIRATVDIYSSPPDTLQYLVCCSQCRCISLPQTQVQQNSLWVSAPQTAPVLGCHLKAVFPK